MNIPRTVNIGLDILLYMIKNMTRYFVDEDTKSLVDLLQSLKGLSSVINKKVEILEQSINNLNYNEL
jgi:hypothetical protein